MVWKRRDAGSGISDDPRRRQTYSSGGVANAVVNTLYSASGSLSPYRSDPQQLRNSRAAESSPLIFSAAHSTMEALVAAEKEGRSKNVE